MCKKSIIWVSALFFCLMMPLYADNKVIYCPASVNCSKVSQAKDCSFSSGTSSDQWNKPQLETGNLEKEHYAFDSATLSKSSGGIGSCFYKSNHSSLKVISKDSLMAYESSDSSWNGNSCTAPHTAAACPFQENK